MLKKTIHYTDYNGNEASTDAYFNLTKAECINMNLEYEVDGGLIGHLRKLMSEKTDDNNIPQKPAIDFVRLLLDRSYGVRPKDDPSLFLKEDDNGVPLIRKFRQSIAYQTYLYELLSGEESLDEFASNVMPKVSEEQLAAAKKEMERDGLGGLVTFPTEGTARGV